MLDSIDQALLAAIAAHPGQHVAVILEGFELRRTTQAYARIRQLTKAGLVELDKTRVRGRMFATLTDTGKKTLAEAERQASPVLF
jgi:DNA-binding MarR family transcriptional regulator